MSDNFDEHARTFNRHGGIRGLADDIDALRAERDDYAARLKATDQSWTKIAAENEDLKRRLAAQDDVVLAARATVAAAHRRGNDIETGLVSGLHDALRRAGLEKLY